PSVVLRKTLYSSRQPSLSALSPGRPLCGYRFRPDHICFASDTARDIGREAPPVCPLYLGPARFCDSIGTFPTKIPRARKTLLRLSSRCSGGTAAPPLFRSHSLQRRCCPRAASGDWPLEIPSFPCKSLQIFPSDPARE